jgi:hypothetical protein
LTADSFDALEPSKRLPLRERVVHIIDFIKISRGHPQKGMLVKDETLHFVKVFWIPA